MTAKAKYDMTVYPVQVAVRSQSDGAAVHMVTLPHCDCADFTNRKGRLVESPVLGNAVSVCKHIAAALESVGGWHGTPGPRVFEHVTRTEALAALTTPTGGGLTETAARLATRMATVDGTWKVDLPDGRGTAIVEHHDNAGTRRFTVRLPD